MLAALRQLSGVVGGLLQQPNLSITAAAGQRALYATAAALQEPAEARANQQQPNSQGWLAHQDVGQFEVRLVWHTNLVGGTAAAAPQQSPWAP